MQITPFQATYPNLDYIASPDSFFDTVKEEYPQYLRNGFYNKTPHEAIYIYQIKKGRSTKTGLLACVDMEDYIAGKILKHEKTLSAKEQQVMHLMLQRDAMIKPILLAYSSVEAINEMLAGYVLNNEPLYQTQFQKNKEEHIFWKISDGLLIQEIQALFKQNIPKVYIADGHHRASTTALLYKRAKKNGQNNFRGILSAFFPTEQLEVWDYNRIVEGLNDLSLTVFMAKIAQLFHIDIPDQPKKPSCKHEISLYINKEWYLLRWKSKILDRHQDVPILLDVHLLNEYVLKQVFNIQDVRTDTRVKYVSGTEGLEGIKTRTLKNENRVGFCLYPVGLDELMQIADMDKVLPPKSTWFEPRLKNGLMVCALGQRR